MDNVTAVAQETSASSEEVLASSEEVSKFVINLENISKKLNEEINKFQV